MARLSLFIAFLCSFSLPCFSQALKVTLIKEKTSRYETKDSTLHYPLFNFSNKKLTELVNKTVQKEFYNYYDIKPGIPVRTALKQLGKDGLTELGHEIHLDDHRFLSFELYYEWLAAYPTSGQLYFCFDKIAGKRITLDSLVIPSRKKAFQQLVSSVWRDSLKIFRADLKLQLRNGEIDSADYESCLEYLQDDCLSSYSPAKFKISKEALEIFFECGFPHVMQALEPFGGIRLRFDKIKSYLRPAYKP